MTMYRNNHLYVRRLRLEDRADFPQYPNPWFIVIDDRRIILGDGRTDDDAKADYLLGREPAGLSPQAMAQFRHERRKRRQRRRALK